MNPFIKLYSSKKSEIIRFLENFYSVDTIKVKNNLEFNFSNNFEYKKEFKNPLDLVELMSTLIDNQEDYNITIWISLDKDILININKYNLDKIIRYLYERYPY